MDRGARQATVHGVTESWSDWATERARTHTHTHVRMLAHTHTCMCLRAHTHTHACLHTHTCMCACTHSLVRAWPGTLDFPEWNSFLNTVWHFRVTAKPSYQCPQPGQFCSPHFPTGYLTMFGDTSGGHTWERDRQQNYCSNDNAYDNPHNQEISGPRCQ